MKSSFLALVVLFLMATPALAQMAKPEPLNHIIIYKWDKDTQEDEHEVVINIDSVGGFSVLYRNNGGGDLVKPVEKFNMKKLEKGIFNLINKQKIPLTPAYFEDEMGEAVNPEMGEQVLHITIVTQVNKELQGDKDYPAEYFTTLKADYNNTKPVELFDHFSAEEQAILQKYLYPSRK